MEIRFDLDKVIAKYNLKQIDLAKATDISPVTISNYRRGTAYPSVPNLMLMSKNLNIPIEEFFSYEDEKDDEEKEQNVLFCPHCHKPISFCISVRKVKQDEKKTLE